IDDGNPLVTNSSHRDGTFAETEGVEEKNRRNTDPTLSAIAAETLNVHHEVGNFLEIAAPGLAGFDFKIPQSFRFNIMSPNVKHADHVSSETSSGTQLPSAAHILPSNTNIDGLDVIILVCDVGIQTER